jgi:hypothetical protein
VLMVADAMMKNRDHTTSLLGFIRHVLVVVEMPMALEQVHPCALTTGQTMTSLLLLLLQECSIA